MDIPAKWHLCDGSAGTPNLTGRFLQGWGWDDFYWRNVGEYVSEGLPNIWGNVGVEVGVYGVSGMPALSGAFSVSQVNYRNHIAAEWFESGNHDIYFNANNCSWLYGNSATVQPRSYVVMYIMKIQK